MSTEFELTIMFFIIGSFFGSLLTLLIIRRLINKKLKGFYTLLNDLQQEKLRELKRKRASKKSKNFESYAERIRLLSLKLTEDNDQHCNTYIEGLNDILSQHGIKSIDDMTLS